MFSCKKRRRAAGFNPPFLAILLFLLIVAE